MRDVKWITNDDAMLSLMTNNLCCQVIELHQGQIDLLVTPSGKYAIEALWIDADFKVHATLRDMQVPKDRISTVGKYREVIVTRIGITPSQGEIEVTTIEQEKEELKEGADKGIPNGTEVSTKDNDIISKLAHFRTNNIPCDADDEGLLFYKADSSCRVQSWSKSHTLPISVYLVDLNNPGQRELYQVMDVKVPKVFPPKVTPNIGHLLKELMLTKAPCYRADNELISDPNGNLVIDSFEFDSKQNCFVVLLAHMISGARYPVHIKSVREAAVKPETSQAVRSSDADAVAYHLFSPQAMERIAARYQLGSDKYGAYNWTKGFSWGQIINHSLRHIFHYLAGDRREDHLAGAAWGLITLMHFEETKTGTNDLHRYVETYDGIKPKDGGTEISDTTLHS